MLLSMLMQGATMIFNMKNIARAAFLFAALPLLAACASGPTFDAMHASEPTLASDSARLYFYRNASMLGSALQPAVKVDGETVGDAQPGGYFFIDRPAGTYEVSTTTEKKEMINVALSPGQASYVRFDVSVGLIVGHIIPSSIDPAQGANEIRDCHYIGAGPKK
jgi:Protein of unknown function (DUF2846)